LLSTWEAGWIAWVFASEGAKFADTVEQVTKQIKDLGPR
jgi:coenzyme F420-reducing hydrogenase delta subunit